LIVRWTSVEAATDSSTYPGKARTVVRPPSIAATGTLRTVGPAPMPPTSASTTIVSPSPVTSARYVPFP
jgi:hypothetical protein